MRALILLLSVVVLTLVALILYRDRQDRAGPPAAGPSFDAVRLIGDALPGESATYRDETGATWTFRVDSVVPAAPDRPPRLQVHSVRRDRNGKPLQGGTQTYIHLPTHHGLFPLMAPQDPDGYDRVWVWDRLRRTDLNWEGRPRPVWRFDLLDPALPAAGGRDHVVAWMDETVPVFGLVRWQRGDRTWDLVDWSPR